MRISRLDLTRYGCFTDQSITFAPDEAGTPDLHVVYGRNEAGKSTLLNAYLDLLFGIGAQTPYAFLHPYPTMRIGARIEFADEIQDFLRIKKAQGGLLDELERPIADRSIQRELGGLERDAYRTMFSLNDASLQHGGESIIASKGDLGVLLFSASAGLADLGQRLGELKDKADEFYRFRARKGELSTLKADLEALKAQRTQLDTLASAYAQLVKERDRLKDESERAATVERETAARIAKIERTLSAMPVATELRRLREQIDPLIGLPAVPPSWPATLQQLQQEDAVLMSEGRRIQRAIEVVEQRIAAITVDENALELREQMAMFRSLFSRLVGSTADLPGKRRERSERQAKIEGILARIERLDEVEPAKLILSDNRQDSPID